MAVTLFFVQILAPFHQFLSYFLVNAFFSSDSVLKRASSDLKKMGQRIFVFIIGGATRSEVMTDILYLILLMYADLYGIRGS